VVAPDVAVEVRRDQRLVFVAEVHHLLFDTGRLVIEHDRHDSHQVAAFEFLVLELSEEIPACLSNDLASTCVAVVVRELVDPFEQLFGHRNTDDAHVTKYRREYVKSYYPRSERWSVLWVRRRF
jgi:hypothetical protein